MMTHRRVRRWPFGVGGGGSRPPGDPANHSTTSSSIPSSNASQHGGDDSTSDAGEGEPRTEGAGAAFDDGRHGGSRGAAGAAGAGAGGQHRETTCAGWVVAGGAVPGSRGVVEARDGDGHDLRQRRGVRRRRGTVIAGGS